MGKKKVSKQTGAEVLKEQDALDEKAVKAGLPGKKSKKVIDARAYINASYNNTIVTITDTKGNMLAWATAGSLGFNGPKKATPFASSKVIAAITEKIKPMGVTNLEIFVKGVGGGRDSALRSLVNQGFIVTSFKDVTPIPHNGPKPKKVRRV
jgi:small subunit ribosomal protein S11